VGDEGRAGGQGRAEEVGGPRGAECGAARGVLAPRDQVGLRVLGEAIDEARELVGVMGDLGGGIFEIAGEDTGRDPDRQRDYLERLRALAVETGVPITWGMFSTRVAPDMWRPYFDLLDETARDGGRMFAQVHSRALSVVLSFKTQLPFDRLPVWKELRALPVGKAEVRREGRRWMQTVKGGGSARGGLHQRAEAEAEVAGPAPDLSSIHDRELAEAFASPQLRAQLTPVFTTDITRSSRVLELDSEARVEASVDQGVIRSGNRSEAVSEIELELKSGEPHQLYELALKLDLGAYDRVPTLVERFGARAWPRPLFLEHLAAVQVGHRHLRRRYEVVLRSLDVEEVIGELGQLPGALERAPIDEERHVRLAVAAAGVEVEHE